MDRGRLADADHEGASQRHDSSTGEQEFLRAIQILPYAVAHNRLDSFREIGRCDAVIHRHRCTAACKVSRDTARHSALAIRLCLQPHLRQPVAQRVAGEAEHARGLALVAVGAAERLADDLLLVLVEREALGQKV